MLATGMDRDKRTRLLIDVGTNCEIVLSDGDRIVSTAAPAGPAFEGGAIRCGMRAADGAIEVVRLGDGVELGVIGDVEPKGLCGSGLVDTVAELVRVGLLDGSGRFVPDEVAPTVAPALADRLTRIGDERVFVLHRPHLGADPADCVVLSQRDVRELQFAKAAISTGWSLLLDELDLEPRDVQQVLMAGSFGTYLSPASAIRIGVPVHAESVAAARAHVVTVSDEEIVEAWRELARLEGLFCEPSSAAGLAAVRRGAVAGERLALTITGHGLKDTENADRYGPQPVLVDPDPDAIAAAAHG